MSYTVNIDNFTREDWERNAKSFHYYNIYQTWPYQEIRAKNDGVQVSRAMIFYNRIPVLLAQVRVYAIPFTGLKFGYVQNGPLVNTTLEMDIIKSALLEFKKAYLGQYVSVLRLVPNVFDEGWGRDFSKLLLEADFQKNHRVGLYHTVVLPVNIPENQIRDNFHRSWRRYLNKAEKQNIEILHGTDEKYFNELKHLYALALDRKNFKGLDPDIFFKTQRKLSDDQKIDVVVAYYNKEPICAHSSIHIGDTALGLLAASNDKSLELSASYLVWWKTLLIAHEKGMTVYDTAGVDPVANPKVYQFKIRMGGIEKKSIGSFDAYQSFISENICIAIDAVHNYKKKK
jgi:lipid II:glycine glycyltransferase (peptidoglycan interpeptide bridge formation enzyme)